MKMMVMVMVMRVAIQRVMAGESLLIDGDEEKGNLTN
jgi:hypothetical protein